MHGINIEISNRQQLVRSYREWADVEGSVITRALSLSLSGCNCILQFDIPNIDNYYLIQEVNQR